VDMCPFRTMALALSLHSSAQPLFVRKHFFGPTVLLVQLHRIHRQARVVR
jgi:hypothetical protein